MQTFKLITLLILLWLENVTQTFAAANATQNSHYAEDALILQKCLTERGGRDLQRISNFAHWNNGEEVRCFTRCISAEKGWFHATENKWNKEKIVTELGIEIWKYCQYELEGTQDDECEYVHQGFRCLKLAEENTRQTYMILMDCAIRLDSDFNDLKRYSNFAEEEHIPCLFKCFAEVTELYDANFDWNLKNWTKVFGPFDVKEAVLSCRTSKAQKLKNPCAWMYEEYLCLEKLDKTRTVETTKNIEVTTSETTQENTPTQSEQETITENSTEEIIDLPNNNITKETDAKQKLN